MTLDYESSPPLSSDDNLGDLAPTVSHGHIEE